MTDSGDGKGARIALLALGVGSLALVMLSCNATEARRAGPGPQRENLRFWNTKRAGFTSARSPTSGTNERTISGRVTNRAGKPVADCPILATSLEKRHSVAACMTGASGRFQLTGLSPGRYSLAAPEGSGNLYPHSWNIVPMDLPRFAKTRLVTHAGDSGVTIRLKAARSLRVLVVDANGRPIEDACVWIVGASASSRGCPVGLWTGRDGVATLERVPKEAYVIDVNAPGMGCVLPALFTVKPGAKNAMLVLTHGLTIRGRVVDASGGAVKCACVGADDCPYGNVTDKAGNFEIDCLRPGVATLSAWSERGNESAHVKVRAGASGVVIRLP